MITPTTKTQSKNADPFKQYVLVETEFDAYDKEESIKQALGSDRTRRIFEVSELRSTNFVEGVSGWRLTPLGLELNSFDFAAGSVLLSSIQNITDGRLLGRSAGSAGAPMEITIGSGLSLAAGQLVCTVTGFTDEGAQDAVGTILADDGDIDFTYDDATPKITAVVKSNSVTFAKMQDISTKKLIGRMTALSGDPEEIDFDFGTYTPTLTNVANLDASTAYACQYIRIGSIVTVSGKVDVDPTAAGSVQLGISLPVASNLANANECAGTAAASGIAGQSAAILGDTTNDRAQLQYVAVDTTNQSMYFSFTYRII